MYCDSVDDISNVSKKIQICIDKIAKSVPDHALEIMNHTPDNADMLRVESNELVHAPTTPVKYTETASSEKHTRLQGGEVIVHRTQINVPDFSYTIMVPCHDILGKYKIIEDVRADQIEHERNTTSSRD